MTVQKWILCFVPAVLAWAAPVSAQDADSSGQERASLEEITVVGTRRKGVDHLETAVPVDIISSEQLRDVPTTNLKDTLQRLVPSFTVEADAVGDQVSFNRSSSLRGLDLGHAVVLLNGKRLHRSSILVGATQSVAIENIPAYALSSIQVLRDGASAQYGADAIAGVINLVMKSEPGLSTFARYGQFYEGDGAERVLGSHLGLPLGETGHLNLTAVVRNADPTDRTLPHQGAAYHIASGLPGSDRVPILHAPYGLIARDDYRIAWNGAVEVSDSVEFYAFGNWAEGRYDEPFSFRPVYDPSFPASSPVIRDDFLSTALTAAELGSRFAYLEGWSPRDAYPGGYIPNFQGHIRDLGVFAGFRGELESGLAWDVSASTGTYRLDLNIEDTINPSLGETPDGFVQTQFDLGAQINQERAFNVDFTWPWEVGGLDTPVNVAFGAEYRRERYAIEAGEPASYAIGPLTDLGSGSDGFRGYSPFQATDESRHNYALYVDLNADVTEQLNTGVAVRFEDFSDFGSTFNWKLSGRYDFTPVLAVRGAVSTGFQAPTVAQNTLYEVSTSFDPGEIGSQQRGIFPPGSEAAQIFGAVPLEPQEAVNFSGGIVISPSESSYITIDAYYITLEDRITQSSDFDRDDPANAEEFAAVDALNIPGASNVTRLNFFTNVFDTRTTGVDVVAAQNFEFANGHTLDLSLGYAYTKTEITNEDEILALPEPPLDEESIFELENDISPHKGSVAAVYRMGDLTIAPRVRFFSTQTKWIGDRGPVEISGEAFLDIDVTYDLTDNVSLSVGADNILDAYPEDVAISPFRGRRYMDGIPWQGGFWYGTVSATF